MIRIGIPRALQFYQSYPMWRTYFEALGAEVVISPPTNRDILSSGARIVADVTCLPVKVYMGHVLWLRQHGNVDSVFVPAIRSVEMGALHCSKFQGLPDLVRSTVPGEINILDLGIDVHRYKISPQKAFNKLGFSITHNPYSVYRAWKSATTLDSGYVSGLVQNQQTYPEALGKLYGGEWISKKRISDAKNPIKVALVGHPYCLYDDYINHDLFVSLQNLGVSIVTSEMVSLEEAKRGIQLTTGQKRWFFEDWMSGAAGHYLHSQDITGVIAVQAFTCGPDSAMVETITRRAHDLHKPFMNLVLDEHGSAAGIITRLEAFVDMLSRQEGQKNYTSIPRALQPAEKSDYAPPNLLREIHKPVLGFPRMGTSMGPLKSLFNGIGVQLELGPTLSSHTVSLGVRHSPEYICTPYKYILGNMIEMLESGADTLLYMDGAELCRNSTYTQLLNDVLHDLGYKFKLVSTAVFEKGGIFALPQFLRQFMQDFSWSVVLRSIHLAIEKMNVLDELEQRVQAIRPREWVQGSVDKVWQEVNFRVDEANSLEELENARGDMHHKLDGVDIDPNRKPVRIATTGEYYAVLEPYFNLDIERVLGKLGVEVHRTLMLGEWLKFNMIFEAMGIRKSEIDRAAKPYLRWNIGGEGLVTVGQAVLHAQKGFDGLIELLPFTCLPEITVLNIFPRLRQDLEMPIISFILDEQSGQAGMKTRLEAFVDLLTRRRGLNPLEVAQ